VVQIGTAAGCVVDFDLNPRPARRGPPGLLCEDLTDLWGVGSSTTGCFATDTQTDDRAVARPDPR
jgi:hypothetical protein